MNRKIKLLTIGFMMYIVIVACAYAGFEILVSIPTSGTLTHPELSTEPTSINWGFIEINETMAKSQKITNSGNVTVFNMTLLYAFPPGFNGSLTWDGTYEDLDPGEFLITNYQLTITHGIEGPFNFTIDIIEG